MSPRNITDPIELIVATGLTDGDIHFVHESEDPVLTKGLDFLLPDFPTPGTHLFIEVKQFHSDWIAGQMARDENVIAVQGREAAKAFATLCKALAAQDLLDNMDPPRDADSF